MGVDLGGTNIHAGVVTSDGRLVESIVRPHDGGDGVLDQLVSVVGELKQRWPRVQRMGLACPSRMDRERGVLLNTMNIPSLQDVPVVALLEAETDLEVTLEHDAAAAALGEGWVGSARDVQTYLVLTLGTGVGTGVVINGEVFRGPRGTGCEWGHLFLDEEGPYRCGCGNVGCIETLCSATALVHLARGEGCVVTEARDVCSAAREGDAGALAALDRYAAGLARALHTYTLILAPELVILSGGLAAACDLFLPRTEKLLAASLRGMDCDPPELVVSGLPDSAGLLGAARMCLTGVCGKTLQG